MREHSLVIGIRGEQPRIARSIPRASSRANLPSRRSASCTISARRRKPSIPKPGPLHQRLERAIVAVVAEVHARCVERDRVRRKVAGLRKQERGLRIDEPLDQPCRCHTVHVGPRARDPVSPSESSEIEARRDRVGGRPRRDVSSCQRPPSVVRLPRARARRRSRVLESAHSPCPDGGPRPRRDGLRPWSSFPGPGAPCGSEPPALRTQGSARPGTGGSRRPTSCSRCARREQASPRRRRAEPPGPATGTARGGQRGRAERCTVRFNGTAPRARSRRHTRTRRLDGVGGTVTIRSNSGVFIMFPI